MYIKYRIITTSYHSSTWVKISQVTICSYSVNRMTDIDEGKRGNLLLKSTKDLIGFTTVNLTLHEKK